MKLNEAKCILEKHGYEVTENDDRLKQLFDCANYAFECGCNFDDVFNGNDMLVFKWTPEEIGEDDGVYKIIIKPNKMVCFAIYDGEKEREEYVWGNDLKLGLACIEQYADHIYWGYAGAAPALAKCKK